MENAIIEILKFTIPALVVMVLTLYLVRAFITRELKLKDLELRKASRNEIIPIRLQAYERMALFIERISLENLLYRLRKPGMSARDLQLALIANIRMEFEHNMSQQIYVSQTAWDAVRLCKDAMMRLVNVISGPFDDDATAEALTKAVLDSMIKSKEALPTQRAMDTLKHEVAEMF